MNAREMMDLVEWMNTPKCYNCVYGGDVYMCRSCVDYNKYLDKIDGKENNE